jgi:hypothetical protein
MKRASSIFMVAVVSLSCLNPSLARKPGIQVSTVTLYSVHKHRGEQRNFCFNFQRGPNKSLRADCDLKYGLLYAGDELDWLESSTARDDRSVIKDLGDYSWTAEFTVPVVRPLPKLKPGTERSFTVDTSGADGADGAAGAPGAPGKPGADGDGVVRAQEIPVTPSASKILATPARPKNDGKPKIDSVWVKAVGGHLYVIHVIDDTRDFYALFRVEELQRGDSCTISWKLIPEPVNQSGNNALR